MSNDDHGYSKAQLEWRVPTYSVSEEDYEAQLRSDARYGGEALSRLVGCWEAPPKEKERPEPEAKLDTMPQQPQQAHYQRPVTYRDRWPVFLGQWWTQTDRRKAE